MRFCLKTGKTVLIIKITMYGYNKEKTVTCFTDSYSG